MTLDHPPDTEGLVASIQIFTARAEFLGAVEQEVPTRPEFLTNTLRPPFIGVESSHPEGISTLVLNYGGTNLEQINDILMDYLSPRIFRTYLPQVVQGGGEKILSCRSIQVVGRQLWADVKVSFFDVAGESLSFTFNGEENS